MQFFIASDHAGFMLKGSILGILEQMGHRVVDLGPLDAERVDYPDFANTLCEKVLDNEGSFGILICGSGIGMSIAANRHKGIRAALCAEPYSAAMSRAHNDANVLCLGARIVGIGMVESILKSFCEGVFEGGRHSCRIGKLQ
ncbi:ribose 5-phosphate isomerase B [Helicobacter winghamensis]|uniref:Ribose 5-phosphate isomerase B n=1 Tax=Helicobacter winghamensis TaxID=157268 RepID=A0A2N3PL98_9HELI|nr:ribose 5-phosphate isomerase B [Helicobacter winghamensis]EEO26710.1 ribose-5-phosphate isomerase B [Helicobacter winghamensis ATCC BAA-430]PKT79545.1 ribose 5-phosphate isomerase B [Helicobacter winghamensis]PKT79663.1 ribose 5-phosphate isomerase B [Helicobacter winghamensis]PKT79716.1 ribose 5-phosphate isomerase B [Helicobacter winghamensis]PKT82514.1 ribose 5-phosphate isomerase B [Helicobacter winghamensis]